MIVKIWLFSLCIFWAFVADVVMSLAGIDFGYQRLTYLDKLMTFVEGRDDETIYAGVLNGKVDLKVLKQKLYDHVMQFPRLKCRHYQVYNSYFYCPLPKEKFDNSIKILEEMTE